MSVNTVADLENVVVPVALGGVVAALTASGRSVACLGSCTKALLWTTTALAVAAVAIQVIAITLPALFVAIPFLPFVIAGVLGFAAISSALAALAINRLQPQKELEVNMQIMKGELDSFQSSLGTNLPVILSNLAVTNTQIAEAVKALSDQEASLKVDADNVSKAVPLAEQTAESLAQTRNDLLAKLTEVETQMKAKGSEEASLGDLLTRLSSDKAFLLAVQAIGTETAALTKVEDGEEKNRALLEKISKDVSAAAAAAEHADTVVIDLSQHVDAATAAAEAALKQGAAIEALLAARTAAHG